MNDLKIPKKTATNFEFIAVFFIYPGSSRVNPLMLLEPNFLVGVTIVLQARFRRHFVE
ncbi:MAG: hypothetical protein ACI80S_000628 [Pseudohongiellaceae bacterium]